MELTANEVAELKDILKRRASQKVKASSPAGRVKLLVGPHGRVTGRVLVFKGDKVPAGHTLVNDDRRARIGNIVKGGKVVYKAGKAAVYHVVNSAGKTLDTIVVDPDDLPELKRGQKFVERITDGKA